MSTLLRQLPLLALLVAFLALEMASFAGSGPPRRFNDTGVYEEMAELPVWSGAFVAGDKPPTLALLFKLVGGGESAVALAQSLLSVVCWFVLGLVLAGEFRRTWSRLLVVAVVCGFSLTIPVNLWDRVLLSESLSLSLFALVLALLLALVRRLLNGVPAGRLTAAAGAAAIPFAMTRDTNIYLLATVAAVLGLWLVVDVVVRRWRGIRPPLDRRLVIAATALLPAIVLAEVAMQASLRWRDPLVNVLLARIVPDPANHALWTERYGLPRNRVFERYQRLKAWRTPWFGASMRERMLADDPEIRDVHRWILDHGRDAYVRFLLTDNLALSLEGAFKTLHNQVDSRASWRFGQSAGVTDWTRRLTGWLYPSAGPPILVWGLMLTLAAVTAVVSPPARLLASLVVLLELSAWVQAFLAIHGDTSNLARHAILVGVLYHLALLVGVLAVAKWAAAALPWR